MIPTPRIKLCMLEMLNKDVILEIENVTLDGSIKWYTIECDYYCIGIGIHKTDVPVWKRLLSETTADIVNPGINHAQV
ncbi:MAG TPA: hypothetical protein ENN05_00110 [Deltaproteobacteria bacterium]|nr:hypothetical protein [Deltaproteobacteria bacterium]